jgi:probable HAF family extracellular repeat protein
MRRVLANWVFTFGVVIFSLITPAPASAQNTYNITDLGTLGGNNSIPFWITNTGEVVGVSDTGQFDAFGNPVDHAFRWVGGRMQDLKTLGGTNSSATGAGDEGVAAGIADVTGGATSHAAIWYKGAITDLGTLSGPGGFSFAQLINDQQQVVGGSTTADGGFHASVWNHGAVLDLGTLPCPTSDCVSFGNGINDLGQTVGGSQVSDVPDPVLGFPPFHATLWTKGTTEDLGAGPEGSIGSVAFNINNKSQVVGRFAPPDPVEEAVSHAFLWESGVMHDLGVPSGLGDDNSEANSLNDSGQIVGDSGVGFIESYAPDHALLWQNGHWTDLNTLIPADSGYYLIVAFDVNARGQIVVWAVQLSTGNIHAALLTPQPSNVGGSSATSHAREVPPTLSENAKRLLRLAKARRTGVKTGAVHE